MWSRFMMSQVKHNSYFIVGMAAGLWLALALVPLDEEAAACARAPAAAPLAAAPDDDFEPRREDKPLGSGGAPAGRAVQRPRYYSTELGMRGSLLTGVLSSEEALKVQVPALNRTLARLQPALKFFITASAMSSVPGLANVVGFTDTREMLKPFHALKYLADNYLEEYDFFYLVTDTAFVNTRRLTELAARLSVSQDLYLGEPAEPGSQYCALDAGVLLSASVLRAVHRELEWCVRNSYSPRHHENLGRCVLHAAHTPCAAAAQGQRYRALALAPGALPAAAALDAAVAARPAPAAALPALHALAARARLRRGAAEAARLRAALGRAAARHPPGYRNATWPAGLRADAGLAPPPPADRFSHLRWTLFNATHAFLPDELRAAAPLDAAHGAALAHVLEAAAAWARRAWPGAEPALLEGARQWDPPAALRYRLLLRLARPGGGAALRALEVVRGLGAARLVPVRYVTESARVHVLLAAADAAEARAFLARYERVALQQDRNTHLYVAWAADNATAAAVERELAALRARHAGATLRLEPAGGARRGGGVGGAAGAGAGAAAGRAAAGGAAAPAVQPGLPQPGAHEHDPGRVVVPAAAVRAPRAVRAPVVPRGVGHGPLRAGAARAAVQRVQRRLRGGAARALGRGGRGRGGGAGGVVPALRARARARRRAGAAPGAVRRGGGGRRVPPRAAAGTLRLARPRHAHRARAAAARDGGRLTPLRAGDPRVIRAPILNKVPSKLPHL